MGVLAIIYAMIIALAGTTIAQIVIIYTTDLAKEADIIIKQMA